MEWNPETEYWEIQTERRATDAPTKGYEVACVATEECARLFMEARELRAEVERQGETIARLQKDRADLTLALREERARTEQQSARIEQLRAELERARANSEAMQREIDGMRAAFPIDLDG